MQGSPRPYANPYLAGFGLGLVLLAAFVLMGRGLGASAAFSALAAVIVEWISPGHAAANPFFSRYLGPGGGLEEWLVWEVAGVFVGGLVSGLLGNRVRPAVERGPRVGVPVRLVLAFLGGLFMGVGAKIAGGCTSGQALTGGALLNVGSWVTMICIFGGAYALAWLLRKEWT
ncbi:MAG: YeeE/YedE family protein [Deltaproteobacteria bacterium]|nr:YeeE/YedE family protein [Deltaproteobacteria bacterium]